MAIYDNNPLVVVEDGLYETLSFCKSLLDRREFGTGLHKLKWITLSNLSALSADRLHSFGTIFYICDRIHSEDDFVACRDTLYRPEDVDTVLLFCKRPELTFSEEVTSANDRHFYSVGVVCDEEEENTNLKQTLTVRCLKLLLMLVTLLATETPSLKHEPIEVCLTPDYQALFCAVLCKLYDFRSEKRQKERLIAKKREEMERLQQTKPKVYTCKNFPDTPQALSFTPPKTKDVKKLYQELVVFFAQCDGVIEKAIKQDIGTVRYAMAAVDWYVQGGDEPTCVDGQLPDAEHPLPQDRDLLRRCPANEDLSVNIENALHASRRFLSAEKPSLKKFVLATLCGIGGFILSTVAVYTVKAANTNDFWLAMKDALPMMWIPLAIFVVAGGIGALLCARHYSKLLSFLREIAQKMVLYTTFVSQKLQDIRQYLNDFITVFYNCHSRDYRLKMLDRGIENTETELKRMLLSMTPYNELADQLKSRFRSETRKQEQETADEELMLSDEERLYTDDIDSVDAFVPAMETPPVSTPAKKPCDSFVSCKNAKECIEYIRARGSTKTSGPDCEPFEHISNPFLLKLRFV